MEANVVQALEALRGYREGSSRGLLWALDEAVRLALRQPELRMELERALQGCLGGDVPLPARRYVCEKLALMGGVTSVQALAGLLPDPELSPAAANALGAIGGPDAARVMRSELPHLAGPLRLGVILALGRCRDQGSVRVLVSLWAVPDPETREAVCVALAQMGNVSAGKALRRFQAEAPETIRDRVADACLACAEHMNASGEKREAAAIYRALSSRRHSKRVREAASKSLKELG